MYYEIILEIWNTQTTPFHPQSDGASERSICTVNNMLAKVVAEDQRNWDLYVSSTCFAYNTAVHSSTGYTPSYLEYIYGRELRLPSDLMGNDQQTVNNASYTKHATELKKRVTKSVGMQHYNASLVLYLCSSVYFPSVFVSFFHFLFWLKVVKHFQNIVFKKTVKLLMFLKYKLFASANQEVANYQSSLVQISRKGITAMTIERPTFMT